jgi:RNA polymerase sigma factor (sigma-70 family)
MHKALLDSCRKGDAKAQKILYDLFKARLMGLCRRYASCKEDAQDILQETFIKIFQKVNQLEDAEKLESWMKRIAVNTAINHYQRNTKRNDTLRYDDIEDSGEEPQIDSMLDVSDQYLIAIINELPDTQRLVFNLFEIEGYNHQEIAELLMIGEGTSRSRLFFAKQSLKEKLSKIGISRYEKYA